MSENFGSYAKCSVCGNPIESCSCSPEQKRKADRTIEIVHKHVGTPQKPINSNTENELERLRRENDDYKSIIALEAEREFKDEKEQIVSQFPESEQDKIDELISDNPDVLEQVKTQLALNPVIKKTSRPTGKASLPNQGDSGVLPSGTDEYREYIDDLFQKARVSNNPIEKSKAEREINKLYNSYEQGMFENPNADFKTVTTQCIQCGSVLTGRNAELYANRKIACPYCGYKGGIVRNPEGQSW